MRVTSGQAIASLMSEGYALVLEEGQAFLTEGERHLGNDRANIPVPLAMAKAVVAGEISVIGEVRELEEKDIAARCRSLHPAEIRSRKVFEWK